MSIWRSALSILGAFFVVAVLEGVTTPIVVNVMLGGTGPDVGVTTAYLVVNLAYSAVFAVIGGYVAATGVRSLAPRACGRVGGPHDGPGPRFVARGQPG